MTDKKISAEKLKEIIRHYNDGGGVTHPDDALYEDEIISIIDAMPEEK